jgi:hypothetical protein
MVEESLLKNSAGFFIGGRFFPSACTTSLIYVFHIHRITSAMSLAKN